MAEPWQLGNVCGPVQAQPISKPEVVTAMVKRAKHPLLILGSRAAEDDEEGKKLLEYGLRIAKIGKMDFIAVGPLSKTLMERGVRPTAVMGVADCVNRLQDPGWKGLDGKGPYDLVLFLGTYYYLESQMLSSLKHFTKGLRTLSLDRYYQPHASWSFPNVSFKNWSASLEMITSKLEES
jgi:acetyl-CoA decarbonylase/synthase complex subunit epsilon